MTWTYVPANLATSLKDQLRLMVQDTDTTDQLLQDEEIAFVGTVQYPPVVGKPPYLAAASLCDILSFKFAQFVQNSVGPLAESAQQRFEHYTALGQQMRILSVSNGKGIFPGSLAGTPIGLPVLGGSGRTFLGTSPYSNPEGL